MTRGTLAERITMPDTTSPLQSLSLVAVCVSSSYVGVGADMQVTESGAPVVIITPQLAPETPTAIYVFSALGMQDGKTRRCYSLVAEFSDREPVCVELVGLSATLKLVRDLLHVRLNPVIDCQTRARFGKFCKCITPDTRERIDSRRAKTEDIFGEHIQHITLLRFERSSYVLEQIGADYESPTTKWRLFSIYESADLPRGRSNAIELESFDDAVCAVMQLHGADEAALPSLVNLPPA